MDHFCTKCGKPLNPNWKICPFCGNKIRKDLWREQTEQVQERVKIASKEEISTNISTLNASEVNKISEEQPILVESIEKERISLEEIKKTELDSFIENTTEMSNKEDKFQSKEQQLSEKQIEKPLIEPTTIEDTLITIKSIETPKPTKNLCPFCGFENQLEKNYCYQCGYKLRVKLEGKKREVMKKLSKLTQNEHHLKENKVTNKKLKQPNPLVFNFINKVSCQKCSSELPPKFVKILKKKGRFYCPNCGNLIQLKMEY